MLQIGKKQQTGKIYAISFMRVLAMLMIVIYHSLYFYSGEWWNLGGIYIPVWAKVDRFLNSLDLSMFVFISGFLYGYLYIYKYKYRDKRSFIIDKIKRLVVPYLVWGLLLLSFQPSIYGWRQMFVGMGHLWFLLMLFWIFCIFSSFIIYISKLSNPIISLLILFGCYMIWGVLRCYSPHHSILCIEISISYMLPFYIGYLCAEIKIWNFSANIMGMLFVFASFLLFLYVFFSPSLSLVIDDLIIRLTSYFSIVGLFVVFCKVRVSGYIENSINMLDRLSMGIYIFNPVVLTIVLSNSSQKQWFIEHYVLGPFVLFCLGFFIPIVFSYLFGKFRCLAWMIGGRG